MSSLHSTGGSDRKEPACNAGDFWVRSLGQEDPLEEKVTTQSRILAWRIPCTEEPGRGHKESDMTEQHTC